MYTSVFNRMQCGKDASGGSAGACRGDHPIEKVSA